MKFLYKIHSGFDGFSPNRIPDRLLPGGRLRLGWDTYLDEVEKGDEVWVYFHGPHRFHSGVYAKGLVTHVDRGTRGVFIKPRESSVKEPLTDSATSQRVAEAVGTRFRQVFLFPTEWTVAPKCNVNGSARTCELRQCAACKTWQGLPRIKVGANGLPVRLPLSSSEFTSAYWVLPRRSFYTGRTGPLNKRTTELFSRFKTGQCRLAFPLALGIFEALKAQGTVDFDCIVPIPLSPAKAKAGEIHRTRLLGEELGRLLAVPVHKLLKLNASISKRKVRGEQGATALQFERKYYDALSASERLANFNQVLIIDDVTTEGSTLRCAIRRIQDVNPKCKVSAVTAGQMIVKAVVKRPDDLLK